MVEKRNKSSYKTNLNVHCTIDLDNVQFMGKRVQSGNSLYDPSAKRSKWHIGSDIPRTRQKLKFVSSIICFFNIYFLRCDFKMAYGAYIQVGYTYNLLVECKISLYSICASFICVSFCCDFKITYGGIYTGTGYPPFDENKNLWNKKCAPFSREVKMILAKLKYFVLNMCLFSFMKTYIHRTNYSISNESYML